MATATRRRRPVEDDEEPQEETPRRRRRPVDDDEDEQPRRRRRPAAEEDDEEEETPRRRRRPEPEDDDDDVEAAPRSRRRKPADDEDDEDETPRRRRTTSRGEDEEERPSRRRRPSRDEDEEDDEPRGRRGKSSSNRRVARGWGGLKKIKSGGDFETKFKPEAKPTIIALLEEEPFAAFARHWVELDEGKRAFTCLASLDVEDDDEELDCPLCDIGDEPNAPKAYLNVVVLRPGSKPEHEVWEIGKKVSEQLEMIDKSIGKRVSLTEVFLAVNSKGSGFNTKYFVEPVFEEDLVDWDVKAPSDAWLDKVKLYDDSLYPIPSERELDKIADQIA